MRRSWVWAMLLVLASCATGDAGSTTTSVEATTSTVAESTTTSAATTTTPETTAPASTTTPSPDAAPPELAGTWVTDLGGGDRVALSLNGKRYVIDRGSNQGTGRISVEGGQIKFSLSNLCVGSGTYQWVIDGESLTLTALEPIDPCPGRSEVLDGVTYTR